MDPLLRPRYAITWDGTQLDLRMSLVREEGGYSGTLRDVAETLPEIILRDILFTENRFSCEFDFPTDRGSGLIKVNAEYQNGTLSGSYSDPTGDSDRVFFRKDSGT